MLEKHKLPGPYNLEKEFQAALHKKFKQLGYFVYRIPDLGPAYRNFDAVVFAGDGQVFCLEYKIVSGMTLNQNKLEDAQHESFTKLIGLGHQCYVVVWTKKKNDYAIIPYQEMMLECNEKGSLKLKEAYF